ncbi:hypothetical protein RRG08_059941 [Elysia crispata]|uniref:Uncharacterized protein n=1 Tax=Elysia crispata TaxID=231223 RepID=A0AAE0Y6J5_9GAST|nr:hypothetical protein RRG08_059941 [Elysia crispata]
MADRIHHSMWDWVCSVDVRMLSRFLFEFDSGSSEIGKATSHPATACLLVSHERRILVLSKSVCLLRGTRRFVYRGRSFFFSSSLLEDDRIPERCQTARAGLSSSLEINRMFSTRKFQDSAGETRAHDDNGPLRGSRQWLTRSLRARRCEALCGVPLFRGFPRKYYSTRPLSSATNDSHDDILPLTFYCMDLGLQSGFLRDGMSLNLTYNIVETLLLAVCL